MDRLDLVYSILIYTAAAMLFLWAGILLVAAVFVLAPSHISQSDNHEGGRSRIDLDGSKLSARSS